MVQILSKKEMEGRKEEKIMEERKRERKKEKGEREDEDGEGEEEVGSRDEFVVNESAILGERNSNFSYGLQNNSYTDYENISKMITNRGNAVLMNTKINLRKFK